MRQQSLADNPFQTSRISFISYISICFPKNKIKQKQTETRRKHPNLGEFLSNTSGLKCDLGRSRPRGVNFATESLPVKPSTACTLRNTNIPCKWSQKPSADQLKNNFPRFVQHKWQVGIFVDTCLGFAASHPIKHRTKCQPHHESLVAQHVFSKFFNICALSLCAVQQLSGVTLTSNTPGLGIHAFGDAFSPLHLTVTSMIV